jgi:hypothetical protein
LGGVGGIEGRRLGGFISRLLFTSYYCSPS